MTKTQMSASHRPTHYLFALHLAPGTPRETKNAHILTLWSFVVHVQINRTGTSRMCRFEPAHGRNGPRRRDRRIEREKLA